MPALKDYPGVCRIQTESGRGCNFYFAQKLSFSGEIYADALLRLHRQCSTFNDAFRAKKAKIGDVLTTVYMSRDWCKKVSVMRDLLQKFSVTMLRPPFFATLICIEIKRKFDLERF